MSPKPCFAKRFAIGVSSAMTLSALMSNSFRSVATESSHSLWFDSVPCAISTVSRPPSSRSAVSITAARREIGDVERRGRRAHGATNAEIRGDRGEAVRVAADEAQRVAARGEQAGGRFGDRRSRADDEDSAHGATP